jgi:hypothetical protein
MRLIDGLKEKGARKRENERIDSKRKRINGQTYRHAKECKESESNLVAV